MSNSTRSGHRVEGDTLDNVKQSQPFDRGIDYPWRDRPFNPLGFQVAVKSPTGGGPFRFEPCRGLTGGRSHCRWCAEHQRCNENGGWR